MSHRSLCDRILTAMMLLQNMKEAEMATMTATRKPIVRAKPIPRALRARAEALLAENYAYMDSPIFKQRGLEAQLFEFENGEPALPLTSWYQPTREEIADQLTGTPQLCLLYTSDAADERSSV